MQQNKMEQLIKENMIAQIRDLISGKQLILGGCRNRLYEECVQNLAHIGSQNQLSFEVSEWPEKTGTGALVLLFGGIDGTGSAAFEQMETVLEQMETLADRSAGDGQRPESVVLVSDVRVYGKSFGETRCHREEELGYVCHTDRKDMGLQCMRTLEHLACKMAREGRIPVKVVRAQAGQSLDAVLPTILETLEVLLAGKDGEIYNLSAGEESPELFSGNKNEDAYEKTSEKVMDRNSPLEPTKILVGTEKLETLV